jgi:hypothetical protein
MLHLVSRMVMAHVTNSHLPHMRAFRAARSAECVFNVAGRVGCRRRLNLNGIFSSVRLDCQGSLVTLYAEETLKAPSITTWAEEGRTYWRRGKTAEARFLKMPHRLASCRFSSVVTRH